MLSPQEISEHVISSVPFWGNSACDVLLYLTKIKRDMIEVKYQEKGLLLQITRDYSSWLPGTALVLEPLKHERRTMLPIYWNMYEETGL